MNYTYYSDFLTDPTRQYLIFVPGANQNHSLVHLSVLFSVACEKKKQENKLEQRLSRGVRKDLLIML